MMTSHLQSAFPVGAQVYTKTAPHGEPGTVTGHFRGKVLVCFPSIGGYRAAVKPESLLHERDERLRAASAKANAESETRGTVIGTEKEK